MAEQTQDQDKSEDATPYKLQRAREKGTVARGVDLSFFAALLALAGFMTLAGPALAGKLMQAMRRALTAGIEQAGDPQTASTMVAALYPYALHGVLLFAGTVLAIVVLFEVIQLRGFVFSAQPLKPDFSRINPAKGLKRLFSLRILKEALKSIVKMAAYTTIVWLLIAAAIERRGAAVADAWTVSVALSSGARKMLWSFVVASFFFAALDQVMARKEFAKQMRMSRRDVTREGRERETDPQLKRKRKQLHGEFVKRAGGLAALPGSDMLIVNPDHVAIALAYDRESDSAPVVRAKARNLHAQVMKAVARRLGIPIFEVPALARALYVAYESGQEIGQDSYHDVAEVYFRLTAMQAEGPTP